MLPQLFQETEDIVAMDVLMTRRRIPLKKKHSLQPETDKSLLNCNIFHCNYEGIPQTLLPRPTAVCCSLEERSTLGRLEI